MSTEPNEGGDLPKLGSLSQKAREKNLSSARSLLIVVGVLWVIINLVSLALLSDQISKAAKEHAIASVPPGTPVDPVKIKEVEQVMLVGAYIYAGARVALGVLFIIFGLMVKMFPVPITIISLVLYVGAVAVNGLLDPMTLMQGIIFKIIIVVLLFKSIQAAIAYQNEKAMQSQLEAGYE